MSGRTPAKELYLMSLSVLNASGIFIRPEGAEITREGKYELRQSQRHDK
jgi:hypothetical protein